VLASGSSIIVAMGGWTEALLLSLGGKSRGSDLLISLFIAAMYTLAAIAALSGLAFWLDALG
jgi:hypothetical protein